MTSAYDIKPIKNLINSIGTDIIICKKISDNDAFIIRKIENDREPDSNKYKEYINQTLISFIQKECHSDVTDMLEKACRQHHSQTAVLKNNDRTLTRYSFLYLSPNQVVFTITNLGKTARHTDLLHFQQRLLEQTGEAIIATDNSNHITFWNHAAETLYCKKRDDVIGRNIYHVIQMEFANNDRETIQREINQNKQISTEFSYYRNSDLLHIHSNIQQMHDSQGNPAGIISIHRDITLQYNSVNKMKIQSKLLNTIGEAVIATRPDGTIYYWNRIAEEYFQIPQSKALGLKITEFDAFQTTIEEAEKIGDHLAKGLSWSKEHTIQQNQTELPVIITTSPIIEQNGEISGIISTVLDISQLKNTRQQLKEIEEKQAAILKAIPDVMLMADRNNRILWCNEFAEQTFGNELVGKYCNDILIKVEGRCDIFENFRSADPKPIHESEDQFYTNDHKKHDFNIKITVISKDKTGVPDTLLVILRDITDHRMVEQDKRNLETQLRRSQRLETIGTMAGGIAHDFNNILTPIIGYTDILARSESNDRETQEYIEEISIAAARAKDLVRQILIFSREVEQDIRPLYLDSLIKETLKLLESSIPTIISIQKHFDVQNIKIKGDATQIHQLIMNLGTNAYQAMAETGGTLEISLTEPTLTPEELRLMELDASKKYVQLSFADTGIGISEKVLDHIFEPFFTTKETNKGTGLGLSVVHGIVKSHQGAITVESELNKGTRFTVFLPIIQESAKNIKSEYKNIQLGKGQTIVFVDDEKMIQSLAFKIIKMMNYNPVCFDNPADAKTYVTNHLSAVDLVVSDYLMPVMKGDELLKKIKTENPQIKTVLTTGFGENINRLKQLSFIDGFILKPLIPASMATLFSELLHNETSAKPNKLEK